MKTILISALNEQTGTTMPALSVTASPLQTSAQAQSRSSQPRQVDSRQLLGGDHLLVIEHAGNLYYLRMTRNNKLILTK
jgi:hemin uptake protein HemP